MSSLSQGFDKYLSTLVPSVVFEIHVTMYILPALTLGGLSFLAAFLPLISAHEKCSLRPWGRPKTQDCVFILNHMIPQDKDPMGFVLWNRAEPPLMSMPIYWFYRQ